MKEKKLTKEASEKIGKEIKKLKYMSPMSAEATVIRNYIDIVLSLPWKEFTKDKTDLNFAKEILDRDHFGLNKIKERILEYLSVKSIVNQIKGPILCLVGPPGVGKTSLAKSVAEALGRKFVKISLGGMKDEAEIRGHRKTYIGSMPGKIIQSCKKAGSSNPVILLDEIDKISSDYRGDPQAVLLEVLDPSQNYIFNDHYLDLDFDLSKCLFIATANSLDTISPPLLDRMEKISLSGYTEVEKIEISKKYLIPKQLKENGLSGKVINFSDDALLHLIRCYTREAGVRNIEREISSVVRKIIHHELTKPRDKETKQSSSNKKAMELKKSVKVTPKLITHYLGAETFRFGLKNKAATIGLATGLAWTPYGGDVLSVEVVVLKGQGKLSITGKLGEVMQESAQAALSYVRSRSSFLGLEEDFYQKIDIHIHVPEGATPKDGPSAGVGMCTAIISSLTQIPVRKDVAMTGEITLRGEVLQIGGLKEKILAAHRGGVKTIIIPEENKKDLEKIPNKILGKLKIVPVKWIDQVLETALLHQPYISDNKKKTQSGPSIENIKNQEDSIRPH